MTEESATPERFSPKEIVETLRSAQALMEHYYRWRLRTDLLKDENTPSHYVYKTLGEAAEAISKLPGGDGEGFKAFLQSFNQQKLLDTMASAYCFAMAVPQLDAGLQKGETIPEDDRNDVTINTKNFESVSSGLHEALSRLGTAHGLVGKEIRINTKAYSGVSFFDYPGKITRAGQQLLRNSYKNHLNAVCATAEIFGPEDPEDHRPQKSFRDMDHAITTYQNAYTAALYKTPGRGESEPSGRG